MIAEVSASLFGFVTVVVGAALWASGNSDVLAARRLAKANKRVADDCARTITEPEVDVAAAALARSIRTHPSNPKPYDREAET